MPGRLNLFACLIRQANFRKLLQEMDRHVDFVSVTSSSLSTMEAHQEHNGTTTEPAYSYDSRLNLGRKTLDFATLNGLRVFVVVRYSLRILQSFVRPDQARVSSEMFS